ncbi:MAG TPA: winged helix-turn-helix domain-containing protein [Candidatus Nitrosocosmicus sp.]
MTPTSGESFEKIYRREEDIKTKERMLLLVLNVVYQGRVAAAQVAGDLHRSKSWALDWLKRYNKEGINRLKNRQKSGRPTEISEEIGYQIKKELKESNYGWRTTKQVEELIVKKSGIKYHFIHIYHILRKWGFKQKVPRKVHVNTASLEEKEAFKKRSPRYLWTYSKIKRKKALL